jgi:hypothetical protein
MILTSGNAKCKANNNHCLPLIINKFKYETGFSQFLYWRSVSFRQIENPVIYKLPQKQQSAYCAIR